MQRVRTVSYNPWGKKNPFLSMWLSGANAALGSTRSQMTAAMRRHTNAAIADGTRYVLALWGLSAHPKRRAKRRSR